MPAAPIVGLFLMVALSTSVVTSPTPPMTLGGGVELLGGCHPGSPTSWDCIFEATPSDPSLVFFRWDFNGDGRWDTGDNASGNWITDPMVYWTTDEGGVKPVHLQAWNGFTTKDGEPVGPHAWKIVILGDTLRINPMWWSRTAVGPASALWTPPDDFRAPPAKPRNVTLYRLYDGAHVSGGLLFPLPGLGPAWLFRFDLAVMSRTFGPGAHEVFLYGDWGPGASFSTRATTIMIL
jgi:hypothetical protein